MTIENFKEEMKRMGISNMYYSLDGTPKHDAFILSKSDSGWLVFYSERGGVSYEKIFSSQNDAIYYMYKMLKDEF